MLSTARDWSRRNERDCVVEGEREKEHHYVQQEAQGQRAPRDFRMACIITLQGALPSASALHLHLQMIGGKDVSETCNIKTVWRGNRKAEKAPGTAGGGTTNAGEFPKHKRLG